EDRLRGERGDQLPELRLPHVDLLQRDPERLQEAGTLGPVGQVVDRDDVVAEALQPLGHVAPDEPCPTRHQRAHAAEYTRGRYGGARSGAGGLPIESVPAVPNAVAGL